MLHSKHDSYFLINLVKLEEKNACVSFLFDFDSNIYVKIVDLFIFNVFENELGSYFNYPKGRVCFNEIIW